MFCHAPLDSLRWISKPLLFSSCAVSQFRFTVVLFFLTAVNDFRFTGSVAQACATTGVETVLLNSRPVTLTYRSNWDQGSLQQYGEGKSAGGGSKGVVFLKIIVSEVNSKGSVSRGSGPSKGSCAYNR